MPDARPISWKRAIALSSLAVYGPFVVMALYTLAFVSCSHCKVAVWKLLPVAPGLIVAEFARRLLNVPRLQGELWIMIAFLDSLALIAVVAFVARWDRWSRRVGLTIAMIGCSLLAIGLLAALRA